MADRPGPEPMDTPPSTPPPLKSAEGSVDGRLTSSKPRSESLARKALQQSTETAPTERRLETNKASNSDAECVYSQRAFKKSSQNGKLTLYLASRDLIVTAGKIDKLQGVLLIDPEILQDKKVYGQVTLTFRYGREDEEVMGLKLCTEAIMSLAQLYPPYHPADRQEPTTAFQEVLVNRFYPNAYPFTIALTHLAPPSVQLVPAKEYNGAPIGTSYDLRVFAAEKPNEKLTRKMPYIKMGIRVIQGDTPPHPRSIVYGVSSAAESTLGTRTTTTSTTTTTKSTSMLPSIGGKPQREKSTEDENEIKVEGDQTIPHAVTEKQCLLSDGPVKLEASLDKAIYSHGDTIHVNVNITNNSNKSVKRIEVEIVQNVDVCMFSNGKFKNIVAQISSRDGCPVEPGSSLSRNYSLRPERGTTKNWIALEDDPGSKDSKTERYLASTVVCSGTSPKDRNSFAIYVSYYVKVKIVVTPIGEWIGNVVSVKLDFTLIHNYRESEFYGTPSPPHIASRILDKIETVDDPNEDPLPYIDKDNSSDEDEKDVEVQKNEGNGNAAEVTNGETTEATLSPKIEESKETPIESNRSNDNHEIMSKLDLIEHYEDKGECKDNETSDGGGT